MWSWRPHRCTGALKSLGLIRFSSVIAGRLTLVVFAALGSSRRAAARPALRVVVSDYIGAADLTDAGGELKPALRGALCGERTERPLKENGAVKEARPFSGRDAFELFDVIVSGLPESNEVMVAGVRLGSGEYDQEPIDPAHSPRRYEWEHRRQEPKPKAAPARGATPRAQRGPRVRKVLSDVKQAQTVAGEPAAGRG